ncbi:MAG: S1 family peptidase [Microthrixaceae bacterium]
MNAGAQSEPSGPSTGAGIPGDRRWQHPSEVGLAVRGRHDRRRSARLAAGVVIGGIGILVTGMLLGSMDGDGAATSTTTPVDGAARSIAHVSVVDGERTDVVTGIVLDDRGHVLVPASAVADADELWVRCDDGAAERTSVLGEDPASGLAVLRLEHPAGEPVRSAPARPDRGTEVVTVQAKGGKGVTQRDGVVEALGAVLVATDPVGRLRVQADPGDTTASTETHSGGAVFDRGGRWVGLVVGSAGGSAGTTDGSVEVVPAAAAQRIAQRVIAAA